jgi:NCS1 family nucleobase:cation symporter-1
LAILISVPPNLPGLISSINPAINVGSAVNLFDFAWLFGVGLNFTGCCHSLIGFLQQFTVASFVYYTASVLFPAHETILEEAVFEDAKVDDKSGRDRPEGMRNHNTNEKLGVQHIVGVV